MGKIAAKQIKTAGPIAVGTSNSPGNGDDLALANHVHAHGSQTDPSMHALASETVNGFMSAADKSRLLVDSNVFVVVAASTANIDLTNVDSEVYGAQFEPNTTAWLAQPGDLLLLKNQTDPKKNGVYKVVDELNLTSWVRVGGADAAAYAKGVTVLSLYSSTIWVARTTSWASSGATFNRAHGNLPTGSQYHANATTSNPGFMSAADKSKVDSLVVLSSASAAISVNSQKITNLATPVSGSDAATKAYADGLVLAGMSGPQKDRMTAMAIQQYIDIVGASRLTEMWHAGAVSLNGSNLSEWKGRVRGISLSNTWATGTANPYVASSAFGGVNVVEANRVQSAGPASPVLQPANSLPYFFLLARRLPSSAGAGYQVLMQASTDVSCILGIIDANSGGTGGSEWRLMVNGNTWDHAAVISHTDTTQPHTFEAWKDGSGNANLRIDGTTTASGPGAPVGWNMDTVGLGCWSKAFNYHCPCEIAVALICDSYPGDTACAALRAWAKADFGLGL